MPSEFEQRMLCVSDPVERVRACTGRVKSVKRDHRTFQRIIGKYDLYQDVGVEIDTKFTEAKQESCDLILDAIQQCRASGINHSVQIVEAIIDARAGEEKHYPTYDDDGCPRKRRRR